jgi:iron complex outermembrane receptor protein
MIRTLAAALATSTCIVALATPAAAQTREYNIPAGSLKAALDAYVRQSGRQVVYRTDEVRSARSAGVRGQQSAEAALAVILAGTGFSTRIDGSLVAIVKAGNGRDVATSASSSGEGDGSADAEPTTDIVVTGSRIAGAVPSSPVITIGRDEIDRSGYATVGEVLRSVPQNFAGGNNPQTIVRTAPGQGNSISGGSAPNLRGLGPSSTLTLINGRRLAEDYVGAVDISLIPIDAIQRVEVVTDGASSVYGSDAVAGVVNFIIRKDFEGFQSRVSAGATTEGGAEQVRLSQLAGKRWQTGNIIAGYEYFTARRLDSRKRSFTEAAADPFDLLPSTSRHSAFLNMNQSIGPIEVFFEGLYASRKSDFSISLPLTIATHVDVDSYQATAGLNAALGDSWTATVFGSLARQASTVETAIFAPFGGALITEPPAQTLRGRSRVAEADVTGPLFPLDGGLARIALGAGHRHEDFRNVLETGAVVFAPAQRSTKYAFGELNLPFVGGLPLAKRLELNIGARHEAYSTGGSSTVTKLGALYEPVGGLSLRGSVGSSFHLPTLLDQFTTTTIGAAIVPNPAAPTGSSMVLVKSGGNQGLRPERATTWTVGADLEPSWAKGSAFSITYFAIDYHDRVASIGNFQAYLTDPANAPFVLARNPSPEAQQALISSTPGGFRNNSGQPYVPANIAAIVEGRNINVARQLINGLDTSLRSKFAVGGGTLSPYLSATYIIRFKQRLTPDSAARELAGRVFNVPRFRLRGGATWSTDGWTISGTTNYLSSEKDDSGPNRPRIDAWTTIDLQVGYQSQQKGLLEGTRLALSVQNLFNNAPPYQKDLLRGGLNYDSQNASPLGRLVELTLTKRW